MDCSSVLSLGQVATEAFCSYTQNWDYDHPVRTMIVIEKEMRPHTACVKRSCIKAAAASFEERLVSAMHARQSSDHINDKTCSNHAIHKWQKVYRIAMKKVRLWSPSQVRDRNRERIFYTPHSRVSFERRLEQNRCKTPAAWVCV